MQSVKNLQRQKLEISEKIYREYKAVYNDHEIVYPVEQVGNFGAEKIMIIQPKIDIDNSIEGEVKIDQNYWAGAEFNRIILHSFMILKSMYPEEELTLTIPWYFHEKLLFSPDTYRILNDFKCHLNFIEYPSNSCYKNVNGNDEYHIYWSLNANKIIYILEDDYIVYDKEGNIKKVGFEVYHNTLLKAKTKTDFDYTSIYEIEYKDECEHKFINTLIDLVVAYQDEKEKYKQSVYMALKTIASVAVVRDLSAEEIRAYLANIYLKLNIHDLSFASSLMRDILDSISKIITTSVDCSYDEELPYVDYEAVKTIKDKSKKLELKIDGNKKTDS